MKDVSKSKKNSRTVMVAVDIDAVDVTEGSPGNGSVPMSLSSTELSQAPGAGDKKRKSRKQSPKLQPTSEFDLVMFKARKQYVGEEERHIKVTVTMSVATQHQARPDSFSSEAQSSSLPCS